MDFQITLRDSVEADFPAVHRYFLEHHSAYNKARGDHLMLTRIKAHRFVIIEQAGAIVGVAGTFRHGPHGIYREAGATRITLNGFGLQKVTHYARALHEHITAPGYRVYFGTVVDSNARSKHNMESVGFVAWPSPDQGLVKPRRCLVEADRKIDFYLLPKARLADHAKALITLAADPTLSRQDRTRPGRRETARLSLRLEILERHREAVERIAGL